MRAQRVLGELDAVEPVAREHLGLGQERVRAGDAAPDDAQRAARRVLLQRRQLLRVHDEVVLEVGHLAHAVEGAWIGVEQLATLEEDVLDEVRVVVVEGLLPVHVEVGALTEHDDVLRVGRHAELLPERQLAR